MSEYGKRCQSCQRNVLSRFYYWQCRGEKGKDKDIVKYRRLCKECWIKVEQRKSTLAELLEPPKEGENNE